MLLRALRLLCMVNDVVVWQTGLMFLYVSNLHDTDLTQRKFGRGDSFVKYCSHFANVSSMLSWEVARPSDGDFPLASAAILLYLTPHVVVLTHI